MNDFEYQFDILVAGAGVAGVAAALECARAGYKTALVEKTVFPGGLATTGLVNIYLPICDGNGRQVTFGIAEELLHQSIRFGPGAVPANWQHEKNAEEKARYRTPFSPASFVLSLDDILESAGVSLFYDTLACLPVVENDVIKGVEVENKSGRGLLTAKVVIDATGDADLAYRAGVPCADGDNWLSIWALHTSWNELEKAPDRVEKGALLQAIRLGANAFGNGQPVGMAKFSGTDHEQVTRFIIEGRKLLRDYYQSHQSDRNTNFPLTLPSMAQFRTTRRIEGCYTLTDNQHATFFADSVGLAADWRKAGYVWEIPLRTLVPQKVRGLLAGGRCISSEKDAWEVTRVIPVAALTGQVAGIAARVAVQQGIFPDQVQVKAVQKELAKKNIPFHLADVGL